MDKKNVFLLTILLMIAISACTTYQYQPTGETPTGAVVSEEDEAEIVLEDLEELEEEPAEELDEVVEEAEEVEEEVEEVTEELEEEVETPVEFLEADVVAFEGDLIDLKPLVSDPDGDPITLGYTSPFDENGEWQTEFGDAGFYSVIITATDGKDSFVTKQMTVSVLVKNKPPVFGISDMLEFSEGDYIEIEPDVSDEDGDDVVVTYSGWMGSRSYQTTFEDAGSYVVTMTADDGVVRVNKDLTIVVNDVNRMPEVMLLSEPSIELTEGGLVSVDVEAADPDGDELTVSFSAPLDENGEWQTEKGDSGTYEVEVVVSDGVNEVRQEVLLEILRLNQAPVIEFVSVTPQYVELKKPGDKVTVSINVEASDPDGDELTYTYSGYMETEEMEVEYGMPGGLKTVTVTVSDGVDSVSQDVTFEINNWPCFGCMN